MSFNNKTYDHNNSESKQSQFWLSDTESVILTHILSSGVGDGRADREGLHVSFKPRRRFVVIVMIALRVLVRIAVLLYLKMYMWSIDFLFIFHAFTSVKICISVTFFYSLILKMFHLKLRYLFSNIFDMSAGIARFK